MDDLLEFVPEDKREAFKEKATGYVRLSDDVVLEYANRKEAQSLRDKIATPIAEARFKNYEETKLPGILKAEREKLMKELHPEETPEQKRIRELEEKLSEKDRREAAEIKKAALRKKAGELGYDSSKAERLAALEDAEDVLDAIAEENKTLKDKIAELEKQVKYGAGAPPGGTPPVPTDLQAQYEDAVKAGNADLALAIKEKMAAARKHKT